MWKEAAMARARTELREERSTLEERLREKVVEEGPGAAALRAVGLVPGAKGSLENDHVANVSGQETFYPPRVCGWASGWRLPRAVTEAMRQDLNLKMDHESAEVLVQENKALLEARAGLAQREEGRTERSLEELSRRLTNDGRDALASLHVKLESEAESKLAEERARLKERLACALEAERDRLLTIKDLKIADACNRSSREVFERAAALREKAERCTARRRSEAVRLLDKADYRAKASLQAFLRAQADKGLKDVHYRFSRERTAALNGVWRDEEDQKCLDELAALAQEARARNDAWLRVARHELSTALQQEAAEKGGESKAKGASLSPDVELRAIEEVNECSRLGRRLVELVTKGATMQFESTRDSMFRRREEREQEEGENEERSSTGGRHRHHHHHEQYQQETPNHAKKTSPARTSDAQSRRGARRRSCATTITTTADPADRATTVSSRMETTATRAGTRTATTTFTGDTSGSPSRKKNNPGSTSCATTTTITTGPVGARKHTAQLCAVGHSASSGGDGEHGDCSLAASCRDCERLLRANIELRRLSSNPLRNFGADKERY